MRERPASSIQLMEVKKKNEVSKENFVLVPAYDSRDGKDYMTLSFEHSKRQAFFSQKPEVEALLRRQPLSPLAEEGDKTLAVRERKGEYYISPEALALLLYHDKKKYAARKTKPALNTRNIRVIDNNPEKFCEFLTYLQLKENEDFKLTYVHNQHAIACYFRNVNRQLKCYIGDSAGITNASINIMRYINSCLNSVDITIGPELQKDRYSCFTFARKMNRFYIKHGAEIFAHIQKVGTVSVKGLRQLPIDRAMPAFLKFLQMGTKLPDEMLNTVVSKKSKKTLGQYLSEYELKLDKKTLNTAALQKRYGYFTQVNEILHQLKIDKINPEEKSPLPAALLNVIGEFYTPPKYINFTTLCCEVVDFINVKYDRQQSKLSSQGKNLLKYLMKEIPHFDSWFQVCVDRFKFFNKENDIFTISLQQVMLIGLAADKPDTAFIRSQNLIEKLLLVFSNNADDVLSHLKRERIISPDGLVAEAENLIVNKTPAVQMTKS